MTRTLVVAHRGGRWAGLAGEQTVAHFERAIAAGADLVEVDLRRTADGHIVCHHDPDLGGRPVAATTLLDLRAAATQAGFALATLADLLAVAAGRVGLDLEVKAGGFEAQLAAQVRAACDPARVVFKSFDDATVRRLSTAAPWARAGLLLGVERPSMGPLTRLGELFPAPRLLAAGARFVSPHHRLLRLGFVARMRALGVPIWVWTVNEPPLMAALLGVADAIITDDPERCVALRG